MPVRQLASSIVYCARIQLFSRHLVVFYSRGKQGLSFLVFQLDCGLELGLIRDKVSFWLDRDIQLHAALLRCIQGVWLCILVQRVNDDGVDFIQGVD